jgi:hypothetical protein
MSATFQARAMEWKFIQTMWNGILTLVVREQTDPTGLNTPSSAKEIGWK